MTQMSIAITNAINNGGYQFVFIDSMSTMLIYNSPESTEKFMHYLFSKTHYYEIISMVMADRREDAGAAAHGMPIRRQVRVVLKNKKEN